MANNNPFAYISIGNTVWVKMGEDVEEGVITSIGGEDDMEIELDTAIGPVVADYSYLYETAAEAYRALA